MPNAFWSQKCPHCHKGRVFLKPVFSFGFMKMYENCPVCSQKYEIEPGFFWGSMYVSYFITVAIVILVGIFDYAIVPDPPLWQMMTCIVVSLIILTPITYRYSRLVMLYYFASIKYDPKAGK